MSKGRVVVVLLAVFLLLGTVYLLLNTYMLEQETIIISLNDHEIEPNRETETNYLHLLDFSFYGVNNQQIKALTAMQLKQKYEWKKRKFVAPTFCMGCGPNSKDKHLYLGFYDVFKFTDELHQYFDNVSIEQINASHPHQITIEHFEEIANIDNNIDDSVQIINIKTKHWTHSDFFLYGMFKYHLCISGFIQCQFMTDLLNLLQLNYPPVLQQYMNEYLQRNEELKSNNSISIHLRGGDFEKGCSTKKNPNNPLLFMDKIFGYKCFQNDTNKDLEGYIVDINHVINKYKITPRNIYVSTDYIYNEIHNQVINNLSTYYMVNHNISVKILNVDYNLKQNQDLNVDDEINKYQAWFLWIEWDLAAKSACFIGNFHSTVSGMIIMKRGQNKCYNFWHHLPDWNMDKYYYYLLSIGLVLLIFLVLFCFICCKKCCKLSSVKCISLVLLCIIIIMMIPADNNYIAHNMVYIALKVFEQIRKYKKF